MVFDQSKFIEFKDDARYDLSKRTISVDKSNRALEMCFIPPATAKSTITITGAAGAAPPALGAASQYNVWNDGSTHYVDVTCGSTTKMDMVGSGILLTYTAVQVRPGAGVPFVGPPINDIIGGVLNGSPTHGPWGVTWNPIANFFAHWSLKGNMSQTPIEQYTNVSSNRTLTTLRYLRKYKRDALETNDQTLFTPCIEDAFDSETAFSTQFSERGIRWLGANGNYTSTLAVTALPKVFTKFIPLSDFFECCENPSIFANLNKARFEFQMNLPTAVGFRTGTGNFAGAGDMHVCVTDLKFVFASAQLQPLESLSIASEKAEGVSENMAYLETSIVPITYSAGSQIVVTNQRNVQCAYLCIPASQVGGAVPDAVGGNVTVRNPIQFCGGWLTSLNCQYGNNLPLRSPLALSATNSDENVMAYTLFLKSLGMDRHSIVSPSLSFGAYRYYHIFAFPIFTPSSVHLQSDPLDLRWDTQATTPRAIQVHACIIRFNGKQLHPSGDIDTFQ
jgi:hypothetical protein